MMTIPTQPEVSVKRLGHVLVTGASGFLGRHVARIFARNGHLVTGIGHGTWAEAEWRSWGLTDWHRADVTIQELQRHAGQPEAVLHCAGSGSVGFSIEHPFVDFERTVTTTAHVLEFVRRCSPSSRVVYPSSASVYGISKTIPISESAQLAPISQYGVHKLMAEQLVASYARQFKLSTAIVRLFSVYGPGLRKQLLWDACSKFTKGDSTFMGSGEEVRDWLHVEDAAELIYTASSYAVPDCPTVNGGSGIGVSVRDLLLHLASTFASLEAPPRFSGVQRPGDPSRYIADLEAVNRWNWIPQHGWHEGVTEYAEWWQAINSRTTLLQTNFSITQP